MLKTAWLGNFEFQYFIICSWQKLQEFNWSHSSDYILLKVTGGRNRKVSNRKLPKWLLSFYNK